MIAVRVIYVKDGERCIQHRIAPTTLRALNDSLRDGLDVVQVKALELKERIAS